MTFLELHFVENTQAVVGVRGWGEARRALEGSEREGRKLGLVGKERMMEFGWWPRMTGTRDLELAGLLVHRGTGSESEGFWGPRVRSSLQRTSLLLKVSHHPPISACHAESENFIFWQGEGWSWE